MQIHVIPLRLCNTIRARKGARILPEVRLPVDFHFPSIMKPEMILFLFDFIRQPRAHFQYCTLFSLRISPLNSTLLLPYHIDHHEPVTKTLFRKFNHTSSTVRQLSFPVVRRG